LKKQSRTLFFSLFTLDVDTINGCLDEEELIIRRLIDLNYYEEAHFPQLPPYTIKIENRVTTIDQAFLKCGVHGEHTFRVKFIFSVDEMKQIAEILPSSFQLPRRGRINGEEGLLYVCSRLSSASSDLRLLGEFFGRNEAHISDYFHCVIDYINNSFGHLLDINQLSRWEDHLPSWKLAYRAKLIEKLGANQSLGRFENCNVVLDGVRLYVSLPSKHELAELVVNSWLGNQASLAFIGIIGGNGLVIGLTEGCGGCENDPAVAIDADLCTKLEVAGMQALCDSIFPHNNVLKPIPRLNQWVPLTGEHVRAASGNRVSVEWAFGEIFAQFEYFREVEKLQLGKTKPMKVFRVGVLLSNFFRCFRGCNANTYFNIPRMTFQDYVSMPPIV